MLSGSGRLLHGRIAPGGPRPAALGPTGGAATGFWWTGWRAQAQQEGGKGTAEAIGREAFRPQLSLPRQALILNAPPGQAELRVGGDQQGRPTIGLVGVAHARQHSVQGLLTEAQGMFDGLTLLWRVPGAVRVLPYWTRHQRGPSLLRPAGSSDVSPPNHRGNRHGYEVDVKSVLIHTNSLV